MGRETSPTRLSATELAERIRADDLSSTEVVRAHIARLEEVNGDLNAVAVRLYDEAVEAAAQADAARARGESLGPLHGVPVTIKEQFLVRGTPSTWAWPTARTTARPRRAH